VGLGVGSCLLASGQRVRFVARDAQTREALSREGLVRTGIFGEVRIPAQRFSVHASLAALPAERLDFVLVCTKTFDSETVARALADVDARLGGEARIVLFHNGWGSAEVFARRLPPRRVFSARVITGFRRTGPAAVEITVHAEAVRIGSLFGASPDEVAPLARAVAAGGLPCEVTADVARDLWAKLLYNCALNPLGALLGVPYGALGAGAETRRILEAVVHEVFAVMEKAGLETDWRTPEAWLRDFYARVLPPTARHEPSMLQDLRAGGRTEIDALSGAVAGLGARLGVPTPVNAALATLVRAAEQRRTREPDPPARA
jgi:2-dehydropantoate 2-reductase